MVLCWYPMDFVDNIKNAGYKLTKPRLVVLECLRRNKKPRTPQEIFQVCGRNGIDLVTVYRTLELFQRIGIVFNEEILGETRYFMAAKGHHHIVCRRCQKIVCLPCTMEYSVPQGFRKIQHILTLSGICNKCA